MVFGFDYANIQWRDNHPYSELYQDGYYSLEPANRNKSGDQNNDAIVALDEANYVFVEGNQLAEKFTKTQKNKQFCIAETGFGTGLNFFAAASLWQNISPVDHSLHFYSIEKHPLSPHDMARITEKYQHLWPDLSDVITSFICQYHNLVPGIQSILLRVNQRKIWLHLIIGDVEWALKKYRFIANAWFLDGFSPANNEQMWSREVCHQLFLHSNQSTSLSTFTAAGRIKRALQASGFLIQKRKGFGIKRESIVGEIDPIAFAQRNNKKFRHQKPWLQSSLNDNKASLKDVTVLVIGAGLSGSTTAKALADKDFQVDVWDEAVSFDHLQHESANGVGNCPKYAIAYVRFYPNETPLSEWCLQSYSQFIRHINYAQDNNKEINETSLWKASGIIQLYHRDDGKKRRQALLEAKTLTSIASFDKNALSVSIPSQLDMVHYLDSGSINVPLYCQANLMADKIHCHVKKAVSIKQQYLSSGKKSWQVIDDAGNAYQYDNVIIANGHQCHSLLNTVEVKQQKIFRTLTDSQKNAFWPVRQVKGQESIIRFKQPHHIDQVLCGSHYLIPIDCHSIAIGAGFYRNNLDNIVTDELHKANIMAAKEDYGFLNLPWDEADIIDGFAGIRCYSPDYIPIVGPLFNVKKHIELMAQPLSNDKNYSFNEDDRKDYQQEVALDGLYICHGMGARGVTSSFLAAKILAASIANEELALSDEILEAVHPARFINRALIKKQL